MSKQKPEGRPSNLVSADKDKLERTRPQSSIVPTLLVPSADEDRMITAAALNDPDALPMTDTELRQLRPARPLPR